MGARLAHATGILAVDVDCQVLALPSCWEFLQQLPSLLLRSQGSSMSVSLLISQLGNVVISELECTKFFLPWLGTRAD
jgi:hypothetical protein